MNNIRFALISHMLPPAPSGQAVILYRILSGFTTESYYLIHSKASYKQKELPWARYSLKCDYYDLKEEPQLQHPNRFGFHIARTITNILIQLFIRTKNIVKILRSEPGTNAIIACTGDLIDIPAGFFASRIMNLPFIAYLFDDYVYQWLGIHRVFAKLISPVIFTHAAGAIGPNEFICEEYRKRYGIETTLVRNPYAEECLTENEKFEWPIEVGKIRIIYTGAIYHANYDCFLNLIQSLNYLSEYDLELHIYTSQTAETLEDHRIKGMSVFINTHISYQEIIQQQKKADILFLPLTFESDISEVIRTSAPGKMGEYLLSGRPVLAHVPPDSFVANFFRENQCGWLVDNNDPMKLAFEIEKIILQKTHRDIIANNAKQVARSEFSPQVARCQFIQQIAKSSDCIPSQMLKIDEEK